jgi:hypothetical protein
MSPDDISHFTSHGAAKACTKQCPGSHFEKSRPGIAHLCRSTVSAPLAKLDAPDVDSQIVNLRTAEIEFRKANRDRAEDPKVQALHQALLEQFVSALDRSKEVKRRKRPPARNQHWIQLGLKTADHPEILLYKLRWFNGNWSAWFVPGFNDQVKNDPRNIRFWACFNDHQYEVVTTARKEFQRYVDDLP